LQRSNDLGLVALGVRRWLVLLIVLAFTASGLTHIAGGSHFPDEAATALSNEFSFTGNSADGEPCCPEHTGQPHASTCSIASGCSLCAPVVGLAATTPQSEARTKLVRPVDAHIGRAPSPQFRPPKLSLNA
jgi:hypothetical protein